MGVLCLLLSDAAEGQVCASGSVGFPDCYVERPCSPNPCNGGTCTEHTHGLGDRSCTCTAGFYPTVGPGTCSPCADGTGSLDCESHCTDCSHGTMIAQNNCTDNTGTTVATPSRSECVFERWESRGGTCSDGTSLDESTCTSAATTNTWSLSSTCELCAPGTVDADRNPQTACTLCPAGQHQEDSGQSGCTACPAGYTSANSTACAACVGGRYASEEAPRAVWPAPPASSLGPRRRHRRRDRRLVRTARRACSARAPTQDMRQQNVPSAELASTHQAGPLHALPVLAAGTQVKTLQKIVLLVNRGSSLRLMMARVHVVGAIQPTSAPATAVRIVMRLLARPSGVISTAVRQARRSASHRLGRRLGQRPAVSAKQVSLVRAPTRGSWQ